MTSGVERIINDMCSLGPRVAGYNSMSEFTRVITFNATFVKLMGSIDLVSHGITRFIDKLDE